MSFFIIEDWNAEVESQEIPGVTGKFALGVQNEAGKNPPEFCLENALKYCVLGSFADCEGYSISSK